MITSDVDSAQPAPWLLATRTHHNPESLFNDPLHAGDVDLAAATRTSKG
jgi:hypothetical protein